MLLEIDAQGSEGLPALTKLWAEGNREVRKISGGYNEDQVDEQERQGADDSRLHAQEKEKKTLTTDLKVNSLIHLMQGRIDKLSQCPDIYMLCHINTPTSTLSDRERRESNRCDTKYFELLIYCTWKNSLKVGANASAKADSSVEQYSKCNIQTALFTL